MTKLSTATIGRRYLIKEIVGESSVVERISELGLVPGRQVSVLQKLPFSGPFVVRVQATYVSLRRDEVELVIIEEVNS